ncbi:MAG TPA: MFS transporter [Afipia sp.]
MEALRLFECFKNRRACRRVLAWCSHGVRLRSFSMADLSIPISSEAVQRPVVNKVFRRLIPFLFILYVVNYLDRINVGFAALDMNRELGLSATTFGIAGSILYVGYVLFEVPSNLMMARFGARIWLARIMICWGLTSAAMMFVATATHLYVARVFLGIFEAGFTPGVILYLTFWIPSSDRARANGLMIMGQAVAMLIGSGGSGLILEHMNGVWGLSGWRWMFLIEGLPAVILGVITYFYLDNQPSEATWLTKSEIDQLQAELGPRPKVKASLAIFNAKILMLGAVYFCLCNTLSANQTWTPTIMREVMSAYSLSSVGFVAAIPPLVALLAIPLWARSSDRLKDRHWHVVAAFLIAFSGWMIVINGQGPILRLIGLALSTAGSLSAMVVFWAIPQTFLSQSTQPAGIALINAIGLVGSGISPFTIGFLKDLTHSFSAGIIYVATLLIIGSIILAFMSPQLSRKTA